MKILNTTLDGIRKRLENRKVQRLSLDLLCNTHLEIFICPLGDNWKTNRMVGTDGKYFAVGVMGFGFYPFNFNLEQGAGYVASKLNLPIKEAEEVANLFNNLKIKSYDE